MGSVLSLEVPRVAYAVALIVTVTLVGLWTESDVRETRLLFSELSTEIVLSPPRPLSPPQLPPSPLSPPPQRPPPTSPSPAMPPWDTRESVDLLAFGYVLNCPVVLDVNNNLAADTNEPTDVSDGLGQITIPFATSLINGEQRPWTVTTNPFGGINCVDSINGAAMTYGILKPVIYGHKVSSVTSLGLAVSESYNIPFNQAMDLMFTMYVQRDHMMSDCTSFAEQGTENAWDCLGDPEYPNALNLCTSQDARYFPMLLQWTDPLARYVENSNPSAAWLRYLYSYSSLGSITQMLVACSTTYVQDTGKPIGNAGTLIEVNWKGFLAIADYVMANHSMPLATNNTALDWVVDRFFTILGLDPATEKIGNCDEIIHNTAGNNVVLANLMGLTDIQLTTMAASVAISAAPVPVARAHADGSWHDRFLVHEARLMDFCEGYQRAYNGSHVCNVRIGCPRTDDAWHDPHATLPMCSS